MAQIYEQKKLRDHLHIFQDRFDAGRVLGRMLEATYKADKNVLLLAIPMGGIPVGIIMAEILLSPLEVVIVRKIQIPGNTESGFGAMTAEGEIFLNQPLLDHLGLSREQVEAQSEKVRGELAERNRNLRGEHPFPDLTGKTVILVDDGLASGFTMKAANHLARSRGAARTIIAVPTAPLRTVESLEAEADEIYCPNIRKGISFAVAQAYENWYDLSEAEARKLLAARGQKTG